MIEQTVMRRGWCPGALRPMPTGDGLLLRLRLTGGIVTADLARVIANCARAFGNGALDLSARANLHIRGVTDATLNPLLERLGAHGALDSDAEAEAVRNVVASPLAGLDPHALLDIRPLVRALERRLTGDPGLHRLPPKFCISVDDGGAFGLAPVASDIQFRACRMRDGLGFAVALGGAQDEGSAAFLCAPEGMPGAAAALADAFLTLRGLGADAPRRMAALVRRLGAAAIVARAGFGCSPAVVAARPQRSEPPLGFHRLGDRGFFGVAAPFGRWTAKDFDRLADVAEQYGNGELRLTIWRAILLPGVLADSATLIAVACAGMAIAPDDPRLAVIACPGAPACSSATTPTRADALFLARAARRLAPEGASVHVSGCEKGCARPASAPATFVGRNGRYDFVRNGVARDTPELLGLTPTQARAILESMNASLTHG